MDYVALISNLLPVTVAGLVLGAGIPALFALGMRISAGQTDPGEDGNLVQVRQASTGARMVTTVIYAAIVAIIVVGILWIAKDFLLATTGFNLFGMAGKK